MKKLHYEQSGDNYNLKDPFKIKALAAAKKTASNLSRFKKYGLEIKEVSSSRGDSAFRVAVRAQDLKKFQIVHLEESIGTKNIVADELLKTQPDGYRFAAIDNVASIMNDLSTSGAFPISFMLHLAAFPNEWFLNSKIIDPLLEGTVQGCNLAKAVWGGGESGTDRDIIIPGKSLLSGSAVGIILSDSQVLTDKKLKNGDRIILLGSSGVHTNGITLLRKELLKRLPQGYQTKLSDGTTYGEALLTPSIIYSGLIEDILIQTEAHYGVCISGHGWRKLMRSERNFSYIIDTIPTPQPIFQTIQKYSNSTDYDMYDTYNMGAGFGLFVPQASVQIVLKLAKKHKIPAIDAGFIKKGPRRVIIDPINIVFESSALQIR